MTAITGQCGSNWMQFAQSEPEKDRKHEYVSKRIHFRVLEGAICTYQDVNGKDAQLRGIDDPQKGCEDPVHAIRVPSARQVHIFVSEVAVPYHYAVDLKEFGMMSLKCYCTTFRLVATFQGTSKAKHKYDRIEIYLRL